MYVYNTYILTDNSRYVYGMCIMYMSVRNDYNRLFLLFSKKDLFIIVIVFLKQEKKKIGRRKQRNIIISIIVCSFLVVTDVASVCIITFFSATGRR